MPEEIKRINKISQETKDKAHRKSALTLPDRPSEHGYSAATIKQRLTGAILDAQYSAFAEIDRIADEADKAVVKIQGDVSQLQTDVGDLGDNKVDKVAGKSLIADTEIERLGDMEDNAQENRIEKIVVGGVEQSNSGKTVTIDPADIKVSDLTDDTSSNPVAKSAFATEAGLAEQAGLAERAERDLNGDKIDDAYVKIEQIVDNVASSDTAKPLSANQGKVLNVKITSETTRANEAEVALAARISAQEGLGGMLSAHDFGTDTPYDSENDVVLIDLITPYALSQIPSINNDETKIWNGTKVSNLFDGRTWQLTNTQNTTPVVFEWVNIGATFMAKATNDTLGVGKGSDTVKVDSEGAFYTSTTLIGAATTEQLDVLDTQASEAAQAAQDAAEFMMYALGTTPIWDAEGEYILADAEDENMLADTYINAAAINGREFYVMSKAEHAALVSAGTYIPDALYLTF